MVTDVASLTSIRGIRRPQLPWALLLCGIGYFLAAELGMATSMEPTGIVILWPANSVLLVALLCSPYRQWLIFAAVAVAAEVAADMPELPFLPSLSFGLVNAAEAVTAATILSHWKNRPFQLESLTDFIGFLVAAPLLAAATAALAGAAVHHDLHPDIAYSHYWRVFWLGDVLGHLLIGTTLLVWCRPARGTFRMRAAYLAELTALSLGLVAASVWALLIDSRIDRIYLLFPIVIWVALRFGARGTSLAILIIAAASIAGAVSGNGPFDGLTQIETAEGLQALIAVVALSGFMLAFAVEDARRTGHELEVVNQTLDQKVDLRTRALQEAVSRNDMLLKEVHHRVKNNLQLVSSLIALQARSLAEPAERDRFRDVQGQIAAIAKTYDLMQQMDSIGSVDFARFVPELCRSIEATNGGRASVVADVSGVVLVSGDAAIALALSLNELITNSVKHNTAAAPAIAVACRERNGNLVLCVQDNGPGFPAGFDLEKSSGFGMQMAASVIAQMGGKLRILPNRAGAVVEVIVPPAGLGEPRG